MPTPKPKITGGTTIPTAPSLAEPTKRPPEPGLVLVWKPIGLVADDRIPLEKETIVGRSSSSPWCIRDQQLSRAHFSVEPAEEGRFILRDRGSRNGVFLKGKRVEQAREVEAGEVIRAGGCLFVIVEDMAEIAPPGTDEHPSFAGRFLASSLIHKLRVAARTGRHVLIEGESGTGKELAAGILHGTYGELGREGELITQNGALFAGEDDAIGGLFGVTKGAFTGVTARTGLLGLAHSGTLFLDELHALPLRVQQALLRFVEDGLIHPLGGTPRDGRQVDVRLVFGTNVDVKRACDEGLLAHDLVARLRRVSIPPLRRRRADIPSIFMRVLEGALPEGDRRALQPALTAKTLERLCLHDYREGNVRALLDLVSLVAARIAEGEASHEAFAHALDETLGEESPVKARVPVDMESESDYERHREEIIELYDEVKGNLSRLQDVLRKQGISASRRWLAIYLDRWGIRPIQKRK